MLSKSAFARLAGVSQPTVSIAVRDGKLIAEDGKLDPAHPSNAAYLAIHAPGAVGSTAAKVAAFSAKARLLRQRLEEREATLVERDVYLRASHEQVPLVRAWLDSLPERRAEELAAAVGCSAETARTVLAELIVRITGELGDIGSEVTAAVMAA